ncbi:MAG: hypothetical protein VW270_31235, partial [Candidatus Poseidoniales archaeon]
NETFDISGTLNEIETVGSGNTITIGLPNDVTIGQDLTVTRDVNILRNLDVTGNITVGGTSATIFTQTLQVEDPDIVLGIRTDGSGNDVSTDNTANHGGIAIASTEGNPLVNLNIAGIETLPPTYKKIMWFKSGSFTGLATDAWLTNYAFGIGTTSMSNGTRLAVGNIEFNDDDITSITNINATGIITASSFSGNGASLTNVDAETLDGLDSTQFLRSDADDITTGQIQFTRANNTATNQGQIRLNGADGNRIDFNQNGVAAPTFTTRSVGTKIALYSSLDASNVDYALGISAGNLWYSVPNTSQTHRWYGGTTSMMTLTNSNLDVVGTITGSRLISDVSTGTAPLTVSSTTLVSNLNVDQVDGLDASQFLRSDVGDIKTAGNLIFNDTISLRFGTDQDLDIYHDGSNSYISQDGTGDLYIRNTTDDRDVIIQSDDGAGGTATYIRADGSSGEVQLSYYNSQRLRTTATGIDVAGTTDTDQLNVSGVSTFAGAIDANGDLDVDGHT